MITDREIENKAADLAIPPSHVEKDYVHSWVLWAIGSRPTIKNLLVLKGGNALRKGYFSDTRFSKDLDFSSTDHIDRGFLESELKEICKIVESQTAVKFLDETVITLPGITYPAEKHLPCRCSVLTWLSTCSVSG